MKASNILYYYASPAVAVLTVILNAAEIIALVKQYRLNTRCGRRRQSVPLIFLANLAVSDLLVGLTVSTTKVIDYLYHYQIIRRSLALGWSYHVLKFAFLRVSLLTSVFNLASMTIDRFLAIRYPMVYRLKICNKKAFIIVAVTWLLSTAFTAAHYCISNFSGNALWRYDMVIFPAIVFPAALIFAVCYTMMMLFIRKQGRQMSTMVASCNLTEARCRNNNSLTAEDGASGSNKGNIFVSKNASNTASSCGNSAENSRGIINKSSNESNIDRSNSRRGRANENSCDSYRSSCDSRRWSISNKETDPHDNKRNRSSGRTTSSSSNINRQHVPLHIKKREIKIYRFAGTVVVVFLLCWLPIAVCGVALILEKTVDSLVVNITFMLAFVNSAIDPIVYFVFNDKICGKMKKGFKWIFRCRSSREEQLLRQRGSNLFSVTSLENNSVLSKARSVSSVISAETML